MIYIHHEMIIMVSLVNIQYTDIILIIILIININ